MKGGPSLLNDGPAMVVQGPEMTKTAQHSGQRGKSPAREPDGRLLRRPSGSAVDEPPELRLVDDEKGSPRRRCANNAAVSTVS